MFSLFFSEYLDHCVEALLNSSDQRIQKVIQTIAQNEEAYEDTIRELVYRFTVHHIEDFTEPERIDDLLQEYIIHLSQFLEKTQRIYIIEVRLRGLEQQLWRLIRVPASFTVADLCYLVFACMRISEPQDFVFGHRDQLFYGGDVERVEQYTHQSDKLFPAFLFPVALLHLHKNSKMSLLYDLNDEFIFELIVKEVVKTDALNDVEQARVIAGQGFGIMNLGHEDLINLFNDLSTFTMSDLLAPSMTLFQSMLDLKSINDVLIRDMETLRDLYESDLELIDDDAEDEDDIDEMIPWFC